VPSVSDRSLLRRRKFSTEGQGVFETEVLYQRTVERRDRSSLPENCERKTQSSLPENCGGKPFPREDNVLRRKTFPQRGQRSTVENLSPEKTTFY